MFRALSTSLAVGACVGALATLPSAAGAATGAEIRASVTAGADWLDGRQQAAGNWTGFGANSVPSSMAAAGRNAADISQPGGTNAQDYLQTTFTSAGFTAPTASSDPASRVGVIEQSVLQGYAAGFTPSRIAANQNLAAQLAAYYTGGYFAAQPQPGDPDARSTNFAVFGTLALSRLGAPRFLVDRTVAAIRANQHSDGGWDFPFVPTAADRAATSGTDMTGAALAALCESGAGVNDPDVREGVGFLKAKVIATGGVAGSEGGFDTAFGGADANSTGWAVTGLNACGIDPQGPDFQSNSGRTPVDFLISLQETTGADAGAFYFNFGDPFAIGPDVGASQDALRALAGGSFVAEAPTRSDPADPRRRPVPSVAAGTGVPIALAVDNGAGSVTFCRVTVPSGASLATLLATANRSSTPGGCATGGEFTGGQVSRLNGQTGTWALSVDGGGEQIAAGQAVRFGDFVALRRTSGAISSGAGAGTAAAVPAAVQARTTPTGVASRSLRLSRRKRVVSVSLRCAAANRLCQGVVYLVYRKRTLARRPFLIGGGKTTRLRVKLSKRAIKRLGKSKKRIRVNVFSRDGAGIASTSTRTVTLTPTK